MVRMNDTIYFFIADRRLDVMMFMNLGVALTCFAFCWTFCIVAFKGWLESRSNPPVLYRISA